MMNKNARIPLLFFQLFAAIWLTAFGQPASAAQQTALEQQTTQPEPVVEREASGKVTVKLARGVKVAVGNRTTGRITITGWDRDTIEARAFSERGVEYVRVSADSSGASVLIKADYAGEEMLASRPEEVEARRQGFERRRKESPEKRFPGREESGTESKAGVGAAAPLKPAPSPTPAPSLSPLPGGPLKLPPRDLSGSSLLFDFRPKEIHLEVKLPRSTEIELIRVYRSDVEVTGMETHVAVGGDQSTIKLSRVGSAEVRSKSGPVEVEKARGLVDVITTSGPIRVLEAGSDVRALSIGGRIEIQCARGQVNVGNTDGPVSLSGVGGDVDATTTNGDIRLAGTIRATGRYHLKSMSGLVEMSVGPNPAGFTATLSSYKGAVETSFAMKISQSTKNDLTNHRVVGRHGDGQAQITLDSFDGTVRFNEAAPSAGAKECF